MKKITYLFIGTCSLALTCNTFGMLNQKNLIHKITKPKNIKHFYINNDLLKENNALLHTIVEQNKENNELLCAMLKQNALHFSIQHNYLFRMPTGDHYVKLSFIYEDLKKKYNLKINPNE